MKKLTAVIPVRAGSQRVKNKNFRNFSNSSLLELKIEQVKKLPVDNIIVNTDSDLAIEIAKQNNVEFHRRESYYASSACTNSEYHEFLGRTTKANDILIAQVTSPLVKTESYLDAIEEYINSDFDSLMSITSFKNFLLFNGEPFNFSREKMPNSQNLPEYQIPTFGIVICNRRSLIRDKNYLCGKTMFYSISEEESIDIDTEFDFKVAELLYNGFNYKKE